MIKPIFEKLAKSKTMNNILDYIQKNPENAARSLVLANVAKDAINCGFYVYQSMNNKDIPEEKRKFVASLDLANGVLMIATQLAAGFYFTTKKVQDKINGKLFGNVAENYKNYVNNLSNGQNFGEDLLAKLERTIEHNKITKKCNTGFKAISTILITTVIAKRVVVPFIATPLASWFKNKYMESKHDAAKNNSPVAKHPAPQNTPKPNLQTPPFNNNADISRYSISSLNDFARNNVLSK